jgi:hypothetical protein
MNWRPKRSNYRSPYPNHSLKKNDTHKTNLILKARLEEIISTSRVSIQRSNIHNDNNEMPHSSYIVEPSSRKLVFETRDLFR